jgi:hypothetical protein
MHAYEIHYMKEEGGIFTFIATDPAEARELMRRVESGELKRTDLPGYIEVLQSTNIYMDNPTEKR